MTASQCVKLVAVAAVSALLLAAVIHHALQYGEPMLSRLNGVERFALLLLYNTAASALTITATYSLRVAWHLRRKNRCGARV